MQFTKAQRKRAKLRLGLAGPPNSGKTWGALKIAKGIGGRIGLIDTERSSAALYSHLADFQTLDLTPPFSPERYIEAMRAGEAAGFDVLIIDSISHEWEGSGGCLEINEQTAQAKCKGNTWAAWNFTTPRHRKFVDAILQSPCHVICTMRSKVETVQTDDKKVKKLGMKAIQRDGTEYELTVVFDIEHENHWAVASKDRTELFGEPHKISEETGRRLKAWLDSGVELAPEAPPAQPQAAPAAAPPPASQSPVIAELGAVLRQLGVTKDAVMEDLAYHSGGAAKRLSELSEAQASAYLAAAKAALAEAQKAS